MKKAVWGIVAAALIAAGVWAVRQNGLGTITQVQGDIESEKAVVKIGAVLDLSGLGGDLNENYRKVLENVINQQNNKNIKYEFLVEDSASQPIRGINAAKKLIFVDKVDYIISSMVNVSKAISDFIKDYPVILFATTPDVKTANGKNSFVFYSLAQSFIDAAVDKVKQQQKKNVLMIVSEYVGAEQYAKGIEEKLAAENIKYSRFNVQDGTRDFRLLTEKIKQLNPDIILSLVRMPEGDILTKQFKQSKLDIEVLGVEYMSYTRHPELYEGVEFIVSSTGDEKILHEIMQRINSTNSFAVLCGYDMVNLIAKINEEFYDKYGRKPSAQEFYKAVKKLGVYEGALGKIKIENTGAMGVPVIIKKFVNGKIVELKE